jgi:hypothetical protein
VVGALVALSEVVGGGGCYHADADPEGPARQLTSPVVCEPRVTHLPGRLASKETR